MKIVADIDLPYVKDYFGGYGELILKPGRSLERADVLDADLLLLRSITPVNEKLLSGSSVKFVGTVTTGFDHLDTAWLDQAGISWRAASGYNAIPVADYIVAVVAALQKYHQQLLSPSLSAGVVGVGRIGSMVAQRLEWLGFKVLLCDPPRAEREPEFHSQDLSALNQVDLLTLHTPLERAGHYPTYQLMNAASLQALSPQSMVLNSGRGEVVDFSALAAFKGHYGFDVWAQEPNIDLQALQAALIATPHLAGYSVQCRYRGIDMIYRAVLDLGLLPAQAKKMPEIPRAHLVFDDQPLSWRDVVLALFDPMSPTLEMKQVLLKGGAKCATLFDDLRQRYIGDTIQRHEFAYTTISGARLDEADRVLLTRLGITIEE